MPTPCESVIARVNPFLAWWGAVKAHSAEAFVHGNALATQMGEYAQTLQQGTDQPLVSQFLQDLLYVASRPLDAANLQDVPGFDKWTNRADPFPLLTVLKHHLQVFVDFYMLRDTITIQEVTQVRQSEIGMAFFAANALQVFGQHYQSTLGAMVGTQRVWLVNVPMTQSLYGCSSFSGTSSYVICCPRPNGVPPPPVWSTVAHELCHNMHR
eukprot:6460290-Amphidinium_carterae.1